MSESTSTSSSTQDVATELETTLYGIKNIADRCTAIYNLLVQVRYSGTGSSSGSSSSGSSTTTVDLSGVMGELQNATWGLKQIYEKLNDDENGLSAIQANLNNGTYGLQKIQEKITAETTDVTSIKTAIGSSSDEDTTIRGKLNRLDKYVGYGGDRDANRYSLHSRVLVLQETIGEIQDPTANGGDTIVKRIGKHADGKSVVTLLNEIKSLMESASVKIASL